jgi:NAD(P)-dependent dehydrogenase (short-subunit alcohol dehydrogenase family)
MHGIPQVKERGMALVLVTGASSGIGLELAQQFAARGDQVIAAVRHWPKEVPHQDVEVIEGADLRDAGGRARIVQKIGTRRLDVVMHNAGVLASDVLGDLRGESLEAQMAVNAFAPLLLTQDLRGQFANPCKLAFITSRMGSIADNDSGGYYGYRMSKAALNAGAKSLAIDLAPQGVAVALLHPGFVRTRMTGGRGQLEAAESARLLIQRIDALHAGNSGTFWHANGEVLPW